MYGTLTTTGRERMHRGNPTPSDQERVVRPLILTSFEIVQIEAAELKKVKDRERKLLKKLAV